MSVLFIFVDGLGWGQPDPFTNPLTSSLLRLLGQNRPIDETRLPFGGTVVPLDANLDLPGLPQSATGQTAIFCGVNAAKVIGYHLPGFPPPALQALLAERGMLLEGRRRGWRTAFVNTYPWLWRRLRDSGKMRLSCTSWMALHAGQAFLSTGDMLMGRSVFQEYRNLSMAESQEKVPFFTTEEAGARLACAAGYWDLALYEYFQSDKAGHRRDFYGSIRLLADLDRFLWAVLEGLDLKRHTVLLTSDHGNIEDNKTGGHTRNPVPLYHWGAGEPPRSVRRIEEIRDYLFTLQSTPHSPGA